MRTNLSGLFGVNFCWIFWAISTCGAHSSANSDARGAHSSREKSTILGADRGCTVWFEEAIRILRRFDESRLLPFLCENPFPVQFKSSQTICDAISRFPLRLFLEIRGCISRNSVENPRQLRIFVDLRNASRHNFFDDLRLRICERKSLFRKGKRPREKSHARSRGTFSPKIVFEPLTIPSGTL